MMPTRRQSSLPDPEAASPAVRYEMVSVSESKIAEIARSARADMIEHTTAQLTRPFPDGWRQDSSNMDPTVSWGVGSHMVCLNFQTWDLGMRLNFAKFLLNGSCGYVLKPAWMRLKSMAPPESSEVAPADGSSAGKDEGEASSTPAEVEASCSRSKLSRMRGTHAHDDGSLRNATYTLLRLELVCARDLPKAGEQRCVAEPFDRYCAASNFMRRPPSAKPGTVSSPYVEVAVHGGGRYRCAVAAGAVFECDATYATKVAAHNGLHPRWAEVVECVAERQDDAILSLHVYDRKRGKGGVHAVSELIAYEALPLHAIRPGYRVVRLRAPTGSHLQFGSLLVRCHFETRRGGLQPPTMKGGSEKVGGGSHLHHHHRRRHHPEKALGDLEC